MELVSSGILVMISTAVDRMMSLLVLRLHVVRILRNVSDLQVNHELLLGEVETTAANLAESFLNAIGIPI
jgi:hypothetical protein